MRVLIYGFHYSLLHSRVGSQEPLIIVVASFLSELSGGEGVGVEGEGIDCLPLSLFRPYKDKTEFTRRCSPNFRSSFLPDVELAIEQYKNDKLERERLQKENERLLSLEHEYKEAVERIEFEKTQLEQERRELQEMEQQHKEAVDSFEEEIAVQIKELERQREELRHFEEEKEKLIMLQEKYEENVKKQEQERSNNEKRLV